MICVQKLLSGVLRFAAPGYGTNHTLVCFMTVASCRIQISSVAVCLVMSGDPPGLAASATQARVRDRGAPNEVNRDRSGDSQRPRSGVQGTHDVCPNSGCGRPSVRPHHALKTCKHRSGGGRDGPLVEQVALPSDGEDSDGSPGPLSIGIVYDDYGQAECGDGDLESYLAAVQAASSMDGGAGSATGQRHQEAAHAAFGGPGGSSRDGDGGGGGSGRVLKQARLERGPACVVGGASREEDTGLRSTMAAIQYDSDTGAPCGASGRGRRVGSFGCGSSDEEGPGAHRMPSPSSGDAEEGGGGGSGASSVPMPRARSASAPEPDPSVTQARRSGRTRVMNRRYQGASADVAASNLMQDRDELAGGVAVDSDDDVNDPAVNAVVRAAARRVRRAVPRAAAAPDHGESDPSSDASLGSEGSESSEVHAPRAPAVPELSPRRGEPPMAATHQRRYSARVRAAVRAEAPSLVPGELYVTGEGHAPYDAQPVYGPGAPRNSGRPSVFAALCLTTIFVAIVGYMNTPLQASLGLARVHCLWSYEPLAPGDAPAPLECQEGVCVKLRRSKRYTALAPKERVLLSSFHVFGLVASCVYNLSVAAMAGISNAFSCGRSSVHLPAAQVSRKPCSEVLMEPNAYQVASLCEASCITLSPLCAPLQTSFDAEYEKLFGKACNVTRHNLDLTPAVGKAYRGPARSVTLSIVDPVALVFDIIMDARR